MATFELILMLLVAVLVSAVLDQLVPKVSLPLIQIALGMVIAFLAVSPIEISIDPEFFLVLFIAPLLFSDAKESNKANLAQNLPTILSFAIGLVLLITLCVGFFLNLIVPSVPLAAAFALGAALGPTDAVAVVSLSKEAHLARREKSVLQGECLLNDASGVVSFQFAIAAAVTGAFSLTDAMETFAVSFVGGIALGVALAFLFLWVAMRCRDLGVDNITFHVLLEVSMPFLVFLGCEVLGVSGILGVVACGIVWSMYKDRKVSPYQSRLNISLSSVWKVIGFVLNGTVFVLLGMQLPGAFGHSWDDAVITNEMLVFLVIAITLLIVGLRFLWALMMLAVAKNPATGKRDSLRSRHTFRDALITTAGGPKGAITLSIILSVPFFTEAGAAFPQRYLLIFLASGVILCTLLIANFLLPLLAPAPEEDDDEEEKEQYYLTRIEVLRTVIERLMGEATEDNEQETRTVISAYNDRIARIRDISDIDSPSTSKLRIQVLDYQSEYLLRAVDRRELDSYTTYRLLRTLMHQKSLLTNKRNSLFSLRRTWYVLTEAARSSWRNVVAFLTEGDQPEDESMLEVRIAAENAAIEYLHTLVNHLDYPAEVVARLLISHERALSLLAPQDQDNPTPVLNLSAAKLEAVQRRGFALENEAIQDLYASGQFTRAQARDLRNNVAMMTLDLEEHI